MIKQNMLKLNQLHGNEKMQYWIEDRSVKIPLSGCWIWNLATDKNGYAQYGGKKFRDKFGTTKMHRISYVVYKNQLMKNQCVCHACDTPLCINPYHLFVGSQKQNMADSVKKNRHFAIKKRKLTHEQVLAIKKSKELGRNLAKKFNVSEKTISFVKNNITYKNVSVAL